MDEKIKSEKENTFLNNTLGIQAIVLIAIGITIGLALIFNYYVAEISNNVTLVVEIGVGVTIAIIVFYLTKKSEKNNKDTLSEIRQIIREEESVRNYRKNRALLEFLYFLPGMEDDVRGIIRGGVSKPKIFVDKIADDENTLKLLANMYGNNLPYDISIKLIRILSNLSFLVISLKDVKDNTDVNDLLVAPLIKELRDDMHEVFVGENLVAYPNEATPEQIARVKELKKRLNDLEKESSLNNSFLS